MKILIYVAQEFFFELYTDTLFLITFQFKQIDYFSILLYLILTTKLSYAFNPDPTLSLTSSSLLLFYSELGFRDIIKIPKYHNKTSTGSILCGLYIWMGLRVSSVIDHKFAFIKIFILSFHQPKTCCFQITF